MAGSRRGPEPRITRAAVLDAARRFQPEQLTMRALARELGVTHGALYRYFPDLKAVLEALHADLVDSMKPPSDDLSWQEWLREAAHVIRRIVLIYPDVGAPASLPIAAPAAHRMIVQGVKVLSRTFSKSHSVMALGLVSQFADGFARSELSATRPAMPISPELQELLQDVEERLTGDEVFERELDIILAGIGASLPMHA